MIKSYFVPIKREELGRKILGEFNEALPPLGNMQSWFMQERGTSMTFGLDYQYLHVIGRLKSSTAAVSGLSKDAEKVRVEYTKLTFPKSITESLRNARRGLPSDVFVNVTKCEENGCEIEVECTPILYRIATQLPATEEFDDAMIQDSSISCERFLKTTFLAALGATPLSEKKIAIPKSHVEFLINDAMHRQIHEKLEDMLDNATAEILIFGYMGTIFVKKLQDLKQKGVKIKLITGSIRSIRQDEMRKEKEKAMAELGKIIDKCNISSKPDFHGRAVIVDNKALIGSMDLDSYSMIGARIEFAIYTEDPEIVRALRTYFGQIFTPLKEE